MYLGINRHGGASRRVGYVLMHIGDILNLVTRQRGGYYLGDRVTSHQVNLLEQFPNLTTDTQLVRIPIQ